MHSSAILNFYGRSGIRLKVLAGPSLVLKFKLYVAAKENYCKYESGRADAIVAS